MSLKKFNKSVGLLIAVVFMLAGAAQAVTPIDSCTTISAPGEYVLSQSFVNLTMNPCIAIVSSDVIFDGAGYTIDGAAPNHGVSVFNPTTSLTNVTVKNIKANNWAHGVYYRNVVNGRIDNNNISSSFYSGIKLDSSNSNTLINNKANSNSREGIHINDSDSNLIDNNIVSSNSGSGILLQNSSNNQITNNNIANSLNYSEGYPSSGIRLEFSDNNQISGNTAKSNTAGGITLDKSSYNNIENNIVSNNNFSGIDLGEGSNYNVIANNNANSNDYGILLLNTSYNKVDNNIANNNKGFEGVPNGPPPSTGIMVLGSHNLIKNNEASDNFIGIAIFSGGPTGDIVSINNTVEGNTANNNRGINSEDRPPSSGIILGGTHSNSISNNIVSFNERGIRLFASNYNNITTNTVTYNNRSGIKLQDTSTYNNILNNVVSSNDRSGIVLAFGSRFNAVASNTVSSNSDYGIYIDFSSDNTIYNNLFNNANNFGFNGSNNSVWNITKTAGTNIVGGAYLGGNVWANNAGTGFSQTCADGDSDGICDSQYILDSNNVDYLPLAYTPTSSIGYSALVATGQNTFVQSTNGSFGLLLKGQTKIITSSVVLNNTGDISAKVEARFNDSRGGVFGLVSGANVLNASNFALGLPSVIVPLSSSGADVQIAVAPPGVTAMDARLGVPVNAVAGDYSGTVILTFSNSV